MNKVKAIILYGSVATGQMDDLSDIDICIIHTGSFDYSSINKKIEDLIPNEQNLTIEFIDYSEDEFNLMLDKGSLFIHHLKYEGKILYGKEYLIKKFKKLNVFKSFKEELKYYDEIFKDLIVSRSTVQKNENFDCSLAFTLIRNISILLSIHNNEPKFGRKSAFEFCYNKYKTFPVSKLTYNYLEFKKINYDRGLKNRSTEPISFEHIENSIIELIKLADSEFNSL